MADRIRKFKINGMPKDKDYNAMPFGRQLEHRHTIAAFKAKATSTHLSQKRQSYSKAIKEVIALNNIDQYYCEFYCSADVKDDTFEFFYTTKTPA